MPEFYLSATDSAGQRETHCIEADTSRVAYERLERQGYRDILLHTSDAEAAFQTSSRELGPLSPAEVVKIRTRSQPELVLMFAALIYRRIWVAIAVVVLIDGYNLLHGDGMLLRGAVTAAVLIGPCVLAVYVVYFGTAMKYRRLLEASSWGRWQEVLALAPQLRGTPAEIDVAAREGVALAALGQVEEGLRRFGTQQTGRNPRWMYLIRVAEIHEMARQYDQALEFHRLAYELNPTDPTVQLDMAMALLRHEVDLPRAQQLIHEVKQQHLSELLTTILPHAEGIAALNAGDHAAARKHFLAAEERLKTYEAAQPTIGSVLDSNRAYVAIALAGLGEISAAREQFERARPRLAALGSARLLSRVEHALVR